MKKTNTRIFEYIFLFTIGGAIYCMCEIAVRGFTHTSMFLAGGLAFLLICDMYAKMSNTPLIIKWILSAVIITAVELSFGIVVNDIFHWNVWDYTSKGYDLYGQICLKNCIIWLIVSIAGFPITDFFSNMIKEDPYITDIGD